MRNIDGGPSRSFAGVAPGIGIAALLAALACPSAPARAQQAAPGFALERLEPAAPGTAWVALDDLHLEGGFAGGMSVSLGYAHDPLRVRSPDGAQSLAVVEHETFVRVGLAASFDRLRLRASFSSPVYVSGRSGVVAGWSFTAPLANFEQTPDVLADLQLGIDARLLGEASGPIRLGASLQVAVPSGDRANFQTDDTYRTTARLLLAGDAGSLCWAGQAGLQLRSLDLSPAPVGPRGNELQVGVGGGMRVPVLGATARIGPELLGTTALQSAFGAETSGLEALLSATLDGPARPGGQLKLKAAVGAGIHARFGAPTFRAFLGLELYGGRPAPSEPERRANTP